MSKYIAQINHYEKITALHKLILIVLQLTNQICKNFQQNYVVLGVFF